MRKLTHIYENNQWVLIGEVNQYDLNQKINIGSLGKINGISIENGNNVDLDLCPYIIVEELPEKFDDIEKNKIYILISKTPLNLPDGIFDQTNFDEIRFTEDHIAGFFDKGNFDTIFYLKQIDNIPEEDIDPSIDNPIPDVPPVVSWKFGVNSTFPIILCDSNNTTYGASTDDTFGTLPIVEHNSDGHYIFRITNESLKVGYWLKLNDNTVETKFNDYLSIVDASSYYQPKGNYVTVKQAEKNYLTILQANDTLLSILAARNIYQQKGNYITVQEVANNYQVKGEYVTLTDLQNNYANNVQLSQLYQRKGDYVLSNDQAYYIRINYEGEKVTFNIKSKIDGILSSFILNGATLEMAGLMSKADKILLNSLETQVNFLTEKLLKITKEPAMFDDTCFDSVIYQLDDSETRGFLVSVEAPDAPLIEAGIQENIQKPDGPLVISFNNLAAPTNIYIVYPKDWELIQNDQFIKPVITDMSNGLIMGFVIDEDTPTITVNNIEYRLIITQVGNGNYTIEF